MRLSGDASPPTSSSSAFPELCAAGRVRIVREQPHHSILHRSRVRRSAQYRPRRLSVAGRRVFIVDDQLNRLGPASRARSRCGVASTPTAIGVSGARANGSWSIARIEQTHCRATLNYRARRLLIHLGRGDFGVKVYGSMGRGDGARRALLALPTCARPSLSRAPVRGSSSPRITPPAPTRTCLQPRSSRP